MRVLVLHICIHMQSLYRKRGECETIEKARQFIHPHLGKEEVEVKGDDLKVITALETHRPTLAPLLEIVRRVQ